MAVGAASSHELQPEQLRDRLARHFGVLRAGEDHAVEYVDVLFPRGTRLPLPGQIRVEKRGPYRPFHDIGILKYLECGSITKDRKPGRNRRDWSAIRFPYDPEIPQGSRLGDREARRRDDLDVLVTEEYVLDSDGVVSVRLRRAPDGHVELHEVCE